MSKENRLVSNHNMVSQSMHLVLPCMLLQRVNLVMFADKFVQQNMYH